MQLGPKKELALILNMLWVTESSTFATLLSANRLEKHKDLFKNLASSSREPSRETNLRSKRGIMDFGGTVLKWLFGVATTSDIKKIAEAVQREKGRNVEVFQMIEIQTSLINEAVWASQTNAKSLVEITNRVDKLETMIGTGLTKVNELEEHATTTLHTDEILDDIKETLTWMEEHTANLEASMATLTIGRLPHQLFHPAQLKKVLNEEMDKLTPGWSFSTYRNRGDVLWNAYRDAEVTTGIIGNQLQAYVHIPTYELATQFQLYEVLNLPEA